MKKHYIIRRMVSLAMAVMLSSGALFTTALAATVTVGTTGTPTPTGNIDVFYYDAATNIGGGNATVTDFNVAQDFISVKLPNDYSLVKKQNASDTEIYSRDTLSAEVLLFTVKNATETAVKVKDHDAPVIFSVAVGGVTSNTIDKKGKITLTPTTTLASGAVATGVTYTVTQGGNAVVSSTTSGVVTIDTTSIVAGSYTYVLTADVAGKKDTFTIPAITIKDVCTTPTFAGVNFTLSPTSTSVEGSATVQVPLTLNATANITSADCTYVNHGTHGLIPEAATYAVTSPAAGVTLSGNTLTINGAQLAGNTTATIQASIKVGSETKSATQSISITKNPEACKFDPTTISYTTSQSGNIIDAETTSSVTFTPTITGNNSTGCAHTVGTPDPFHGKTVQWEVTKKGTNASPAGVNIGSNNNNLTLTITKAELTGPETTIVVKAYVREKPAINITQEYKITKTGACTLKITSMGGVGTSAVSAGSGIASGVFTVNSATATLQLNSTPTYDNGKCDFVPNGLPCANAANHTPVWSISAGSPSVAGISIDSKTGLMSVNYSQLTNTNTSITVKVKCGNSEPVAYITVRRGTLPSSGGGNDSAWEEQQRKSEQWDKLEYKIEDAESKDVVSMDMGNNTEMPTRVVRDIVGQNITVELTVDGGYTWIVRGKDIKKPPTYQIYMGLGVKSVKNKDATKLAKDHSIKVLELEHEGSFYGTYTLEQRVDTDYSGKYLYMYKFDEDANKLYYRGSAKVDSDGYVKFPFTSASTYVMTDKALYGEKAGSTVSGGGSTSGGGGASVAPPPASSVAPPPASSSVAPPASSSSSESSSTSSEPSSEIELPSSSEVSSPTDAEPEEPEEEPAKKSIPLIVPILLVVVTITIVAVILLAKGGMNIGG